MFAMGFTLMALEVLLLLAYQAAYGSVYQGLAWMVGAFMSGMGAGAWASLGRRSGAGTLAAVQGAALLAPLALCALLAALCGVSDEAGRILIFAAAFGSGFLGGFQFPPAIRISLARAHGRSAAGLYALDLAGSCAGALLISAYLVPLFGFTRTAVFAALVNLGPAAVAALGPRSGGGLQPEH